MTLTKCQNWLKLSHLFMFFEKKNMYGVLAYNEIDRPFMMMQDKAIMWISLWAMSADTVSLLMDTDILYKRHNTNLNETILKL